MPDDRDGEVYSTLDEIEDAISREIPDIAAQFAGGGAMYVTIMAAYQAGLRAGVAACGSELISFLAIPEEVNSKGGQG